MFFRLRDPVPHETGRFCVDYSLADLPDGPNTGVPCCTAAEWASEVWTDLDEQIDTGGVRRALRSIGPDGTAVLTWRA